MTLGRRINAALKKVAACLSDYRLVIFYSVSIAWLELVYRLWSFKVINADYLFPVIFSIPAGVALFLLTRLSTEKVNRVAAISFTSLLSLLYGVQLVYFSIFQTPLSFFSLTGAGDALQFQDVIGDAILKNIVAILLLLIPIAVLVGFKENIRFSRIRTRSLYSIIIIFAAVHVMTLACVYLTGDNIISQRSLYYRASSPTLSASRLGLLTTMRLDLMRLVSGTGNGMENMTEPAPVFAEDTVAPEPGATTPEPGIAVAGPDNTAALEPDNTAVAGGDAGAIVPVKPYNIMDIDFAALAGNEKDPVIKDMHGYFSNVEPTKTNEYTGIFKGYNLILITAEAFSPYAVSPELTPTLYKMSQEGFVFNNFYNPVWGISTSDGEYVACTGLIPKTGVWSFARSGKNYMPFVMGNQFKKLGYPVKAYHDHTYTYYKRNISHPNMGYDYKGVGNGLNVKKTWPESDVEMIEVTSGDFISTQPFHNYYMTVSGHMSYNFSGNYMAKKNRARVEGLNLSVASKAYIAANLEMEDAMRLLLDKLEAAGIAGKTVIALSADHYPYGLPRESLDELAGHKLENNFELYKSTFILYRKGMEPVVVDKPCASLDIIPTLSNLFGLEYDSRLLMGRDILSDSPPLVIFSNYSWITDRARFNAAENTTAFTDGSQMEAEYVRSINKAVADKFKYSAKILDKDYYGKVFGQ